MTSKIKYLLRCFLHFGDWGLFILLLLQETVRTLGSRIAVHSYINIQMWISCTLGLQSIAQISTKHDTSLLVLPQTSSKIIHNSAHST